MSYTAEKTILMVARDKELLIQLSTKLALIVDEQLPLESRMVLAECRKLCSELKQNILSEFDLSERVQPQILSGTNPKKTILVIDDDQDILRTLIFLFKRKAEFQVITINDPLQALETLKTLRPSAILTDLMMPHMTGFELLQRIRSISGLEKTPIAVGSSRSFDKDRLEALRAGANEFIAKPYNFEELALRLHNLCGLK